jgi:hypothetical protein
MDGGALAFFQYADDEAGPCVLMEGYARALQGCVAGVGLAGPKADLLHIMEKIGEASAGFRSLAEHIDTTTPAGRMMMQMVTPSPSSSAP